MTAKNRSKGKTTRRQPAKSSRKSSESVVAESLPRRAWDAVTDGRGHDLAGIVSLLLAVVAGASVYSGAAKLPGSAPNTFLGVLLGVLKYLVPPVLVVVGVLLIRGPRPPSIDLADDNEPWDSTVSLPEAKSANHYLSRIIGVVLGVLVLAGIFDLLLVAEEQTITNDGYDAYASGGGIVGAMVGALDVFGGRWTALVLLILVGVFTLSLITGRSVRDLARALWNFAQPGLRAVASWLATLFHVGGTSPRRPDGSQADGGNPDDRAADESTEGDYRGPSTDSGSPDTDPTQVERFFDQDASGATARTGSKKRSVKHKPPKVRVSGRQIDSDESVEQLELDLDASPGDSPWRLPAAKLLSRSSAQEVDEEAVAERGRRLEGALAEHGVETRLIGMTVGPAATRYELELGVSVRVAKVTALQKDIAYAMASPDVRILAPIPGRSAIGVEVPNAVRELVTLGDILSSGEARRAAHPLEVGIGRGMNGENVMLNLAAMPHILIAGQTGAGKSSCINSILTSLMMRATPEQVRMILVDPKLVELTQYSKIPHLLTQVVTDPKKAANALGWATAEMERRYSVLSEIGVRDIDGYNRLYSNGELDERFPDREFKRMPFILVVVDELANLMLVAAKEVENSINILAAKARAVGIHLVLATQRPSVDVITGLIKSNIPARLAFAVTSATDSKVILDQGGAEKLTGKGDMLLLPAGVTHPQRIQGSWVSESEVREVAAQWHRQAPAVEETYSAEIVDESTGSATVGSVSGGDDDELLIQAMELVVRGQMGSTSMLQRKLKVGFARAGRLMDLLEERGVVGPSEGSKARKVLITPDEFDRMIDEGEI